MALAVSNALANLENVGSIPNWVEAVDQESIQRNAAASRRSETIKDGVKTVIDYIDDKEDGKSKVITTYKVVTKKVPRVVAERKKWNKFGASANDGQGPHISTTYVVDEVEIQFVRNRFGEKQEELDDKKSDNMAKGFASKAHCRICKSDDHWSVNCPYKEIYQIPGEEAEPVEKTPQKQTGIGASGKYVNPFSRGDRSLPTGQERRSDDYTCRVTNLPEDSDTLDEDLRSMFGSVGRIERFFLARDKATNKPKGFAFITFSNRDDSEKAIQKFNGCKMHHLILKVELATRNDK